MEQNQTEINSVQYILQNYPIPHSQKVIIKQKDRPTPDLQMNCVAVSKSRTYRREFNRNIYDKYKWICGCPVTNRLFCFICLLSVSSLGSKKFAPSWTRHGVNDLKHLAERTKKHQNSIEHLNAYIDFSVLGKMDVHNQLDNAYLRNKIKHNEEVEKNRHILRRLIMCIRFCGAFELASRGHDERKSSDIPSIYNVLINFAAELDSLLAVHLKDATVFNCTPKMIQNELLDAMFAVYRTELIKQIKSANFIALEADEITDASNQQQMVIIIRYIFNNQLCERFWSFIRPKGLTSEKLANALLSELKHILSPSDNFKLIAQSYNGTSVMTSKDNGVQAIIKQAFPHAYFIHCYAHQFGLVMEQAAQCHKKVKIFFANLQSFLSFFSQSPKRASLLDEAVKKRSPQAIRTRWNFRSRPVNTLYEYKDSFSDCLERIIDADGVGTKTISEACALLNHLKSPEFLYWLKIFHLIMPHVETFFIQAQTSGIKSFQLENAIEQFKMQIMRIRACVEQLEPVVEPPTKLQKTASPEYSKSAVAKKVCDSIILQIKERFDFKDHLNAAKLFDSKNFKTYRQTFPREFFEPTVKSYSMLDSDKLKSELTAMYERDDMCNIDGMLSLLLFLSDNNFKTLLSETYKLVEIICTTPMATSECERCFSTLNRITTFLRSTVSDDRINALAVLSIEKTFIQCISDFDNKVIDTFCNAKNRRMDFMYR